MSTPQAMLVFGGIPLAIVGLIAAAVFAAAQRYTSHRSEPPVGIVAEQVTCNVQTTDDGRVVHTASDQSAQAAARVCWTVRCAECEIRYSAGSCAVHFNSPVHGISVTAAHGWRLAGTRIRCPKCA